MRGDLLPVSDSSLDLLSQGLQGLNVHMNTKEGKGPGVVGLHIQSGDRKVCIAPSCNFSLSFLLENGDHSGSGGCNGKQNNEGGFLSSFLNKTDRCVSVLPLVSCRCQLRSKAPCALFCVAS